MIAPELWAAYEAAVVSIEGGDAGSGTITLPPVADGVVPPLPAALRPHVHVVTACNPRSVPQDDARNAARQRELAEAIDAAGWTRCPAVGRDVGDTWREPSFAVVGAPRSELLVIAGRFSQNAVYEWTPDAWRVVVVPVHP